MVALRPGEQAFSCPQLRKVVGTTDTISVEGLLGARQASCVVLRGCLNWRSLQPLHVRDEFSDSLVALVDIIGRALVNDAPYRVGGWRKGFLALEDIGKDVADRVHLVHDPVVLEAAEHRVTEG